jgi:hypothetical protein
MASYLVIQVKRNQGCAYSDALAPSQGVRDHQSLTIFYG